MGAIERDLQPQRGLGVRAHQQQQAGIQQHLAVDLAGGRVGNVGLERLQQQHLVKLGRRQWQIERTAIAGHGHPSPQHDKTGWRVVGAKTLRRRNAGRTRQTRAEPGAAGRGCGSRVALPLGITHPTRQHAVARAGLAGREAQHGRLTVIHHRTRHQHSGQGGVGAQLERQTCVEQTALGAALRRDRKALGGLDGDHQVLSQRAGDQRDRAKVAHHQRRKHRRAQHQLVFDPLLAVVDLHRHAAAVVHQPRIAGLGQGYLGVEQRAIEQLDGQQGV